MIRAEKTGDELHIIVEYHGRSASMNFEILRPRVHFTPEKGYMNDPNGLVKYKDIWFLFYQWNPTDTCPGNTHWGMAKSRDLLHWEHLSPYSSQ